MSMPLQLYDAGTGLALSSAPTTGAGAWLTLPVRYEGAFGVYLSFLTALGAATTFTVEVDDGGAGFVAVAGPLSLTGLPDNQVMACHSENIAKLSPLATKIRIKTSLVAAVTAWVAPLPSGNLSRIDGVPTLAFTTS
jgi:hypothetical protein